MEVIFGVGGCHDYESQHIYPIHTSLVIAVQKQWHTKYPLNVIEKKEWYY
jgi:hypothetical protein